VTWSDQVGRLVVYVIATAGGAHHSGRLYERFEQVALVHPGREAIVSGRRLSYQELWRSSVELAEALEAEVRSGDRVALQLRRPPELAAAMLGIWRAGGVVVPLHPMMEPPELRAAVAEAAPRVLLFDAESVASPEPSGRQLSFPTLELSGVVVQD
jgi:acyl-CoA synthetase (AMP-forming)/AMP-acid ligase II